MFWIDASTRNTLEQSYRAIAAENIKGYCQADNAARSVTKWLGNLDCAWLLIMDNTDDPDLLPGFWPQGTRGNVIYTSKNKEHGLNLAEDACCPVNEMEEDEAVTLLASSKKSSCSLERIFGTRQLLWQHCKNWLRLFLLDALKVSQCFSKGKSCAKMTI